MITEPQIHVIRALGDNFIHVLSVGQAAMVVDPGDARVTLEFVEAAQLEVELVLATHAHGDHTAGCMAIRAVTACRLAGPGSGADPVADGDELQFEGHSIHVVAAPGHTADHVAYYMPTAYALFSGDALFAAGCGRVSGDSYEEMWATLERFRTLPVETRVYCGHDYLVENLEFAHSIEPKNEPVSARLANARRGHDQMIAPTLELELQTNPFLRCDEAGLAEAVGLKGEPAWRVFRELRRRKDNW